MIGANLTLSNMFDAKLADAKMARIKMEGAIGPHGQRVGANVSAEAQGSSPLVAILGLSNAQLARTVFFAD